MGSISSNVQNDLEGSLIIYKGKRFADRIHIVGSETFERDLF